MANLQRQLDWSKKQTSYAWAKYYAECNTEHITNIETYTILSQTSLSGSMPAHFIKEFEELTLKLKNSIDCPICLDIIAPGTLDITNCGHKYCKTCLDKVKATTKKCSICRKKICK